MRTSKILALALAVIALPPAMARADDTKPPVISDVKASAKGGKVSIEARITDETGVLSAVVHHRSPGGKVEDANMVKNDYDDVFKASFPGSGDTEYWLDSSDLLGNGPSTYGSQSKPYTASGKPPKGAPAVAKAEPPPRKEEAPPPAAKEEPAAPPPEKKERKHHEEPPPQQEAKEEAPPPEKHTRTAKASGPPTIEHRAPSVSPAEGQDFTVRMKIHSDSPVEVAILRAKANGQQSVIKLTRSEGDSWEGKIPGSLAHGSVEYFIAAKTSTGAATMQGNGDPKTPYVINFKPAGSAAATASATPAAAPSGPFGFTHNPLYRVVPGKNIVVRAQVVPSTDDGQMPDRVAVLWRGNDAQDQITDMVRDESGGWGGYKAELPPSDEGAIFYQVVACDGSASKCGIDTGSKHKWHAAAIAGQAGGAMPLPLDAVSSKAPPALPE